MCVRAWVESYFHRTSWDLTTKKAVSLIDEMDNCNKAPSRFCPSLASSEAKKRVSVSVTPEANASWEYNCLHMCIVFAVESIFRDAFILTPMNFTTQSHIWVNNYKTSLEHIQNFMQSLIRISKWGFLVVYYFTKQQKVSARMGKGMLQLATWNTKQINSLMWEYFKYHIILVW